MTHYDTAAIRSLARRLESTASSLSSKEQSASRQISSLSGAMQGDTINAIGTSVEKLDGEVSSIVSGLNKCAETLYRYARELDIAEEKANQLIKSR